MKKVFLLFLITILIGCTGGPRNQKKWIYENLPSIIWQDITYEKLNTEYLRLVSSLTEMADNIQNNYYKKSINTYYGNNGTSQMIRAFDGLESMFGTSYHDRVDNQIEAYNAHCKSILNDLGTYLSSCLYLRDSIIDEGDYELSDQYLFETLMGTPREIPDISEEQKQEIAMFITLNIFQSLSKKKPIISSIEYNKHSQIWHVRMDNSDNQYVKFYHREDGDYDVEYSSTIDANGAPITTNTITTPL